MFKKHLFLSFLALLVLLFQQVVAQNSTAGNSTAAPTVPGVNVTTPAGNQTPGANVTAPAGDQTTPGGGGGSPGGSTPGGTTTTTVTTTTITTTTNGHLDPSINQICPQNKGVNDKIRRKALEMHNWRRSTLAMGQVTKRNNNPMPRASNMIELKYDCDVEVGARVRAESCDTSEIQGGLENKHMVPVSSERQNRGHGKGRQTVVERKDHPLGMAVTFRDQHQFLAIRSFARMAWANTQKIGCAVKRCGQNWNVVCRYDPAGKIVNQQIYIRGKPCSRCPSGASCRDALCVLP